MKRLVLALLLSAVSAFAAPPEKWYDAYNRGVTAVNAKSYKAAADALQKAIAEMPNEGTGVRTRKELITYVPHFWLGIAKFNLDDPDGALREWRISEEQGVVARTEYYARMKDWVARAQEEKRRNAQTVALGPKKAADVAISKALEMQLNALSSGGDRSENYQAAQRKLMEARGQFQKAGSDVSAYKAAEETAGLAAALFGKAADDGKKLKAARAAVPPPVRQPVQQAQVVAPPPAPVKVVETPPAPLPKPADAIITEAEVAKRIADQEAKRRQIEEAKKVEPPATQTVVATALPQTRPDLRRAYRAFASGDLASSEQLLTGILVSQPAAEAFLLRGCARYTRAMLSRTPDPLLLAATDDFRAALDRNRSLRLDRNAFSPKLVAFFEQVRQRH